MMEKKTINALHVVERIEGGHEYRHEYYHVILCKQDGTEETAGIDPSWQKADEIAKRISKETEVPVYYFAVEDGMQVERKSMEELISIKKKREDEIIENIQLGKVVLVAVIIAFIVWIIKLII